MKIRRENLNFDKKKGPQEISPFLDIKNNNKKTIKRNRKSLNKKEKYAKNQRKKSLQVKLLPAILIILLIIVLLWYTYIFKKIRLVKEPEQEFKDSHEYHDMIMKDPEQEFKDSHEYYDMIMKGKLYDNKTYYPSENPKISIILPVHNGEAFVNQAVLSIQNQDLKDIEIIIIDDYSTDGSEKVIKDLIKTEPRISFYKNEENMGQFYTKTKGILHAKGKYVMTLDDDDKYLQRDALSTLYNEAEKEKLDIIQFNFISIYSFDKRPTNKESSKEEPIIYQPELSNIMLSLGNDGKIIQKGNVIWNKFIRTDLFIKVIKKIDEKYFKEKIYFHDDCILFFLLTRNAKSYKNIHRTFYLVVYLFHFKDSKVLYRRKEKKAEKLDIQCKGCMAYIEFVFEYTENNKPDKKIAFAILERWFLDFRCRNNPVIKERAVNICQRFLNCPFIEEEDKNKIRKFLN